MIRANIATAIISAGLFGFAASCGAPGAAAETHTVEMRGLEFFPAEIDVAVGDTIIWVNADVTPHTATAADGSWDSGMMQQGDEWAMTIETAGRIDYVCTFHPAMTGVINAE